MPTVNESATGTFFPEKVPLCLSGVDAEPGGSPCTQASNEVHSLDGTRAFYHVDPVKDSKKWVIFLEGGGSCGVMPGFNTAAEACYGGTVANDGFKGYSRGGPGDPFEMSSAYAGLAPGVSNLYNLRVGQGPMRPDAGALFENWNRIIVDKTTFDRFYGTHTNASVVGNDTIDTYFHGAKVIRAMLNALNRAGGPVTADNIALTKLSDADCVILIGNSGGAGGVIMLAERFKGWVNAIAPNAMVYFVADSRMLPGLNGEAKFANAANSLWSNTASGTTRISSSNGGPSVNAAWSNTTYATGYEQQLISSWGDPTTEPFLDPSCLASHVGAPWPCFDEQHVLAHHTDEDFFLHQTLLDSVHGNTPLSYYDTINGTTIWPPFRFNGAPSGNNFMNAKSNRVIYVANELLQNRKANRRDDLVANPPNRLGVYIAYGNCHTTSLMDRWQSHTMTKNGVMLSAEDALQTWLGSTTDNAWIQDSGPNVYGSGTWSAAYPITNTTYSGWNTPWGNTQAVCPP